MWKRTTSRRMPLRGMVLLALVAATCLLLVRASWGKPSKTEGHSLQAQAGIAVVEVDVESTAELRRLREMGHTCDSIGPCRIEADAGSMPALKTAGLEFRIVERAIKWNFHSLVPESPDEEVYEFAAAYSDVPIGDDGTEYGIRLSIDSAPDDAVVSRVRYSLRVVHPLVSDLWLDLATGGGDRIDDIWHFDDGLDHDDDAGNDGDIELLNRESQDFDGQPVNDNDWELIAYDYEANGVTGFVDYLELWVYYEVPPANDDFDNAFEINNLPYFHSQDYDGATRAADDPNPSCDDVGGTVWYRYTAPQDEVVRFQIGGIAGEWLAIFTGTRGNLTEVACDRGSGTDGWWSRVDLPTTAGTTYHILIGPDDSDEGYMEIEAYRLESTCDTIVDIPQSECAALRTFYDQMTDPGDIESTWFKSDTACSWYGITCSAGHVTELNLKLSYLNGKIVPELEDLTQLSVLELGRNEYWSGGIPPELGNLSHLEVLDLGSNYLLDGPIPPELGNLDNLVILNLEQNDLTGGVPSELGNLSNLRELYLDWTFLSGGLPQNLTNLDLLSFWFHETDLCEPGDTAFQNWLQGIDDLSGTGVTCTIGAPILFEISNNDGDGNYTVSWSNVSSADSYQLQEQHDDGSWNTVYNNSGTSVNRTGRSDGEWCYQVRASNAGDVSGWSNVECTIVDTPPEAPNLLSPEDGSSSSDGTPPFAWTTPSSATHYRLQVDTDGAFSGPDIDEITTTSTYTPNIALGDATYYWRVQAQDATGNWSAWSDVWTFTVNTNIDCESEEDADGDGLLDGWEACGYDHDGDGNIDVDLPAMGADPEHKDIFVEIDYMAGVHSHRPSEWAMQTIIDSFDRAPVSNPDGTTGIHLHVDYGRDAPLTWAGGTWGTLSRSNELIHRDNFGTCVDNRYQWDEFKVIKASHFPESRLPIFHYNLWVHSLCPEYGTVSGIAYLASSDFIVSSGAFAGNAGPEAGTFMHELGHNLGLHHGGNDDTNYKPNYLSVMNYSFQFHGLIVKQDTGMFNDGYYDYSRYNLSLDERALDEEEGLPIFAEDELYGTKWYCEANGFGKTTSPAASASKDIDWNCDNGIDREQTVATDINRSGTESHTFLGGHNDWANLVFDGGAIGGLGTGEELPNVTEIDELTLEEAETIPSIETIYIPLVRR